MKLTIIDHSEGQDAFIRALKKLKTAKEKVGLYCLHHAADDLQPAGRRVCSVRPDADGFQLHLSDYAGRGTD